MIYVIGGLLVLGVVSMGSLYIVFLLDCFE